MKVTDIKAFVVDCFRTNWVFVKVYTDEGIDGVGEATLEYKEKALLGALEHIKEYLVGKDPRDIEKHWHTVYRDAYWRGGAVLMSALSAVEMAMWDILGKSLNVPVYTLLGGKYTSRNGDKSGVTGGNWNTAQYTQLKRLLREAQREMHKTRSEAARNGVNIPQSKWETATVSY